jgi:hypothetical protein
VSFGFGVYVRVVISEVMDWIKVVGIGVIRRFRFNFDFRNRDPGSGKFLCLGCIEFTV